MSRAASALLLVLASTACAAPLAPGTVPPPRAFDISDHVMPPRSGRDGRWQAQALDSGLLDAIAPLGTGTANAAAWWRDFSEADGRRESERRALHGRAIRREVGGAARLYYAWDEPLVQEARATADQARMSFYPAIWSEIPLAGPLELPVPLMIVTSTSWLVHGLESRDPEMARDDFRRMIRLGRLLLQDDASLVQSLVGLRIVGDGLEALYERARIDGNEHEQALVALALLDRERTYFRQWARLRTMDLPGPIEIADPSARVHVTEQVFEAIDGALLESTVRRWKLDALLRLQAVTLRGDAASAARAKALLERTSADQDPLIASAARRALAGEHGEDALIDVLGTNADQAERSRQRERRESR